MCPVNTERLSPRSCYTGLKCSLCAEAESEAEVRGNMILIKHNDLSNPNPGPSLTFILVFLLYQLCGWSQIETTCVHNTDSFIPSYCSRHCANLSTAWCFVQLFKLDLDRVNEGTRERRNASGCFRRVSLLIIRETEITNFS